MAYLPESGASLLPYDACAACVFSLHCMTTPRETNEEAIRCDPCLEGRRRVFVGRLCRNCGNQVEVVDEDWFKDQNFNLGFMDYATFIAVPGPCRTMEPMLQVVCPGCKK